MQQEGHFVPWQGLGNQIWKLSFRGDDGRTLVATCLGTPPNSIIVSRVPVGQKNLKRLVSWNWKPQKSQNRGLSCKLHNWTSKTSKISNALSARLKIENFKSLKTTSCASCAFLQSPGDIFNCSICLMPVFGVGNVYRFWSPKGGPPVVQVVALKKIFFPVQRLMARSLSKPES